MVTLEMDFEGSHITCSRGRQAIRQELLSETSAKVAVILLSLNGEKVIAPCLKSLFESDYSNIEVIVVDNGSSDSTAAIVRERFPRAKLISTGENLGFAGGNNVGLAATDADIVILLNDDTTVRPNMVSEIANFMASDPDAGIVGCKILYPDGKTIQHAGAAVLPNGLTKHYGYGETDEGQFERVFDVAYVTGAAIAIRREVMDKIGHLDAGYFPIYFEEVEYCERARRAGFRVVYLPSAVLLHYESQVTVKASFGFYVRYHLGRLRFVLKNFTGKKMLRFMKEEIRWLRMAGLREQGKPLGLAYLKTLLRLPAILFARRRDWIEEQVNPRITKSAIDFSQCAFYNRLEGFSPIQEWCGARVRAVVDQARFGLLHGGKEKKLHLTVGAFNGHITRLKVQVNGDSVGDVEVADYLHTLKFNLPPIKSSNKKDNGFLQVVLQPIYPNGERDNGYRLAVKSAWVE
ncbi:MAG: glycosyltransferase family 2 protein [Candidatus Coatesbacteria bacterium]|nr:glycosyltransferase family 2 protein [Candidatus Coatesbacteria bacterium]